MLESFWKRPERSVLIVSGDPGDPLCDSAFLHCPGLRLLISLPGDDGFETARRELPNLVVDSLSGESEADLDLCRRLRTDPQTQGIPIILVVPDEARDRAERADVDELLRKPVGRRDFFEAVSRYVPMPERRARRVGMNIRFIYSLGSRTCQAFSRDICRHGAFLKSDYPPRLGETIEVRFFLPGVTAPIVCDAIVRSTRGEQGTAQVGGFGVEFANMSDADDHRLETFVEQCSPRSFLHRR